MHAQLKKIFTLVGGLLIALMGWTTTGEQMKSIITTETLGGEERYLIYTSTDKPIYRTGENVYLRNIFLNAKDNTPINHGYANIHLKIRGPKGDIVFQQHAQADESSAGVKWTVPEGTPGGQYTALISSPSLGSPETERTFEIRAYRAPRLKNQIEFTREGYGPGDTVQAAIQTERAEGGVPKGAKITVIARVDGKEVFKKEGLTITEHGNLSTEFTLPKNITVGDGSIAFVIEDGGVVETASKTIPILLQTLDIQFYPEGGDLIAGLENRVYLQATRPDGKPADIKGRIVKLKDNKPSKKAVASISTSHEGRGIFRFTPDAESTYVLVLDKPSGITKEFSLPASHAAGTVIKSLERVFENKEKIRIQIDSNDSNTPQKITLYKREKILDDKQITLKKGKDIVALDPKDSEGVLMVTVWDKNGKPVAERLVYRAPKFALNIDIDAGEGPFIPGAPITLDITTTDENGKPVEAIVGLTVTDDTVLEMIEKREQAPRLPVMVYLENDVQDLADAQFYLDENNPLAHQALDLLLGTQGWRRFILIDYDRIKNEYSPHAQRALAQQQTQVVPPIPRAAWAMPEAEVNEAFVLEKTQVQAAPKIKRKEEKALANMEVVMEAPMAELRAAPNMAMAEPVIMQDRIQPLIIVREYAYKARPNRQANDRTDFTETLYWHKGIRTDARSGKASVSFDLSDSITSFRVMADSFGRNGALGSKDHMIRSVEPFYIEPKMPLSATAGDVIELPVALINASDKIIDKANIIVQSEGLRIVQPTPLSLAPGERARQIVRINTDQAGSYTIKLNAAAGSYSDSVTRVLNVKPKGFPIDIHKGGLLGPQSNMEARISIPETIEKGSLKTSIKIFPSPLANMEEALNALLREPYGCFEQTSSTTYPLVMAQQYFISHQGIAPEKINQAKTLLDRGYKKLIGFESKGNGYEWFGANPAHEALTAYGLMEFVDMSKVMPVDKTMIERTRQWLLDRRNGQGGFKKNEKALDSFGRAPEVTTNAYIIWALLESGENPNTLRKEIAEIKEQTLNTKDNYIVALAANIFHLSGDTQTANILSQKLADAVNKEGAIENAITSITRSGGDALRIETTSLALLAWLKNDAQWAAQVEHSMKWLFERSKSGRFGSTQSTVLALKAINAYDAARAKPKQAGSVQLLINGKAFGKAVDFSPESKGAILLPDFSAALTPGEHTLSLVMTDGSKMPYALEVTYHTSLPTSSKENAITLKTTLSKNTIKEGESLEMQIDLQVSEQDAPTPIAIIGLPAGVEVRHDQLKELVGADRISAYEVIDKEVILYWRALKAKEKVRLPLQLTAAIPGTYTAPASRAYLYYTDEHKQWEKGESITIKAR